MDLSNKPTNTFTATHKDSGIEVTLTYHEPFAEGHVLNAVEAATLNQTWMENLRNNTRTMLAKAAEAAAANGEPFDPDAFRAAFSEYESEYEFGGSRRSGDPVEAEAMKLATDAARKLLRSKNYKLSEVKSSDLRKVAEKILAKKRDSLMARAASIIEAKRAAGSSELDDLGDLLPS